MATELRDTAMVASGFPAPLSLKGVVAGHHSALIGFLRRRLRVEDDAHDVAQEAYLRMMQYEGSCAVQSPGALLFRIATNVANDLGRRPRIVAVPTDSRDSEAQQLPSERASPDRELEAMQDLELVHDAIARLPDRCRQVFLLSRFHDMTYPQIARHCGISVKMVEKHISHALMVCATQLKG